MQVLEPVVKIKIPRNARALGSNLFTVKKFPVIDGDNEKLKSQFVSHRYKQDTLLYPDRSSPTAAVHRIMTTLAISACNRNYALGMLDVKGTFIHTEMKGTPTYIKCRVQVKDLTLATYPDYCWFIGSNSILYCRLKRNN